MLELKGNQNNSFYRSMENVNAKSFTLFIFWLFEFGYFKECENKAVAKKSISTPEPHIKIYKYIIFITKYQNKWHLFYRNSSTSTF